MSRWSAIWSFCRRFHGKMWLTEPPLLTPPNVRSLVKPRREGTGGGRGPRVSQKTLRSRRNSKPSSVSMVTSRSALPPAATSHTQHSHCIPLTKSFRLTVISIEVYPLVQHMVTSTSLLSHSGRGYEKFQIAKKKN